VRPTANKLPLPVLESLRRRCFCGCLLTAAVLCCPLAVRGSEVAAAEARAADAAETADRVAAEYIDNISEQLRLEATRDALNEGSRRLARRGKGIIEFLGAHPDAAVRKALLAVLERSDEPVVDALKEAAEAVGKQEKSLREECRTVRTELAKKRMEVYQVEADQRIAGQLAFLLNVDNRWFWFFGLTAIVALAGVVTHERRHEIRRRLNGGKARAMGLSKVLNVLVILLVVVTLATFLCGDSIYHWLLQVGPGQVRSPEVEIEEQNRLVKKEIETLSREKQEALESYDRAWDDWVNKARPAWLSADAGVLGAWKTLAARTREINVALHVQKGLAEQLKTDLEDLKKVQEQVTAIAQQRDENYRRRQLIKGELGLGLTGLATVGGLLFLRTVRRRQEKIRDTCPLCLAEGTFEPADGQTDDSLAVTGMVQCKNLISEQPYEECEFTFLSVYRDMAKLCFPTLGLPSAGKTHWLAMTYRELIRGNYADRVQFKKVKSSVADDFERIVDGILNKRISTAATDIDRFPRPLVFNFSDRDRMGRSNVLVNIFDYSGEVTRAMTLKDRQRCRALEGDGFLFFLDPTKMSEFQAKALEDFSEDLLHVKKGVRAGKQIRTPVALCVSKLDLMVKQPYADRGGDGMIQDFYRSLEGVGWGFDLPSIEARSKLVAELHDTIWPGWRIERKIHDLFGGRYMFFPLTPVGIDGRGEEDLEKRIITPLGLLEPLLWLLHMNGYPVFA